MAKLELSFEDACEELTGWTKALLYEIEHNLPEIRKILSKYNASPLPPRRRQALLLIYGVKGKLNEVRRYVKTVEQGIRKSGTVRK
jgi:hypothetical protein